MSSTTVYLKIPQVKEVYETEVYLGMIADVHSSDRAAEAKAKAVKITSFSGTFDAGEGITVEEIGGHAEGSSVVWIEHPRGRLLLAGDESYLAANWEKPVLLGTVYNKKKNLEFLNRVKTLHERMGARLIVIPFHEPALRPEGNGIQRLLPR